MSQNYQPGGDTETNNIGALADGFLGNTAINDPDTSGGSTAYIGGLANGDNRDNTSNTDNSDNSDNSNNSDNSDNSSDITVDATLDLLNGNNRDNSYDWDYDSKTTNTNINDNDTPGSNAQECIISTAPQRRWDDPTTWGTLFLKPRE